MHEHFPAKLDTPEWLEQRGTLGISNRAAKAAIRASEINEQWQIKWKNNTDMNLLGELGLQLIDSPVSEEQAKEMYRYFHTKRMSDFYGRHQSFLLGDKPDHVKMARTDTKTNILCPYVIELMTDERLISMASEYLGAPATLNCVFPLWSFKEETPNPINMQLFHSLSNCLYYLQTQILETVSRRMY